LQPQHHPVENELSHLHKIEERGESPATPLIMGGFAWVVAAVIVIVVTAATRAPDLVRPPPAVVVPIYAHLDIADLRDALRTVAQRRRPDAE
jgi:hypothetical protein